MKEVCGDCKFFIGIANECRFNAPVIGIKGCDKWPWMAKYDFCGQWKPKRKEDNAKSSNSNTLS